MTFDEQQARITKLVEEMKDSAASFYIKGSPFDIFFTNYLEVMKEEISMANDAESFMKSKSKRDFLLAFGSEIKQFAETKRSEIKEQEFKNGETKRD